MNISVITINDRTYYGTVSKDEAVVGPVGAKAYIVAREKGALRAIKLANTPYTIEQLSIEQQAALASEEAILAEYKKRGLDFLIARAYERADSLSLQAP